MYKVKRNPFVFILVFVFCVTGNAFAMGAHSSKHVLDNGMKVIITEMPTSQMVSVYALVQTGSANERKFLGSGISHLLEHLLFKGTENRKQGEIAAHIQAIGGTINASTGQDNTIYTITVPYEHFDTALDIQSDMLQNTVFDEDEFEKEKNVIKNEMRMLRDNPARMLNEISARVVYTKHPYGIPVIGYEDMFERITIDDAKEYYGTHYIPNNIILSIAGKVKTEDVLPKVKNAFKDFKRKSYIPRNLAPEPEQITERIYEEEYPTDLVRISMAFSGIKVTDDDLFALDLLAKILGGGKSSRLYKTVYRQKQLVLSVYAFDYTPVDRGTFEIGALLDYANVKEAISSIMDEINAVKEQGVTPKELDKVKNQVSSEILLGLQESKDIAYTQAFNEADTGDYDFSMAYIDSIKKVTQQDILRVANKYLKKEKLSITVLKPKGSEGKEGAISKPQEFHDIEKIKLKNGITLLLKEDHSLPVASIRLTANGGLRVENLDDNGISKLIEGVWDKGTNKLGANDIAEKVEGLGIELSTFSGKNSLGIGAEFVSDKLQEALGIISDIVENADFKDNEIEKTRDILKAAIKRRKDSVVKNTVYELKKELFKGHYLAMDPYGTPETLNSISRKDILALYKKLIVSKNIVISVFGDFDRDKVVDLLNDKFSFISDEDFKMPESSSFDSGDLPEDKQIIMDKDQAMVIRGFRGPDILHKDKYAIDVLSVILGSSFSGRLFNDVRQKLGEAYSVGGDFVPGFGAGMIYFYALTSPGSTDSVKKIISDDIEDIKERNVSNKELLDAKEYLKGEHKRAMEPNYSFSLLVSLDELYGLGYNNYKDYEKNIDSVTADDVRSAAVKYLDSRKSVIVTSLPNNLN